LLLGQEYRFIRILTSLGIPHLMPGKKVISNIIILGGRLSLILGSVEESR
jgi:hypothetical protein